ncbi:MAG: STAS/SEC14 domain-containing protein [Planctomycetes bacterium]|nr:STAS/SEC14 domain-containing protein [Planctomycetota bacterium]
MIRMLPSDGGRVVAMHVSGRLTHEDYERTILPRLERALAEDGKLRCFAVLDAGFTGLTPHAMWDDLKFDLAHRKDFERIALVTDSGFVRAVLRLFRPLFSGEMRLYPLAKQSEAEAWLLEGTNSAPTPKSANAT